MLERIFLAFVLAFFLGACSNSHDNRLKISATTWIGYTPLYECARKGWLEPLNIKLLNISSLAENMYIYQAGNSDAYTGTQYEYNILKRDMKSLQPIMMFDQSNGGDLVMSNLTIEELSATDEVIDAYLEMDSINNIILEDFLKSYHLTQKKINYLNRDQVGIKQLKMSAKPTLIVTYVPYNIALEQRGYKPIASTKESLSLVVVDAMFTKKECYLKHKKQFDTLKSLVDRSIESLKHDPKEFYETIRPYILDMSYEEFIDSLEDIRWINRGLDERLRLRLEEAGFTTKGVI